MTASRHGVRRISSVAFKSGRFSHRPSAGLIALGRLGHPVFHGIPSPSISESTSTPGLTLGEGALTAILVVPGVARR